jgi:hypothetical protein
MGYDAILAQVIAHLQQEKRLAYRVLKRRFQLDDDLLEDLKDDLIYAKQLAVDEEGKVLVWVGRRPCREPRLVRSALAHAAPVPRRPSAASSRYCSVTSWSPRRCRLSSTLKSGARWCEHTKPPVPR